MDCRLLSLFSKEEVLTAIKQMFPTKAPSPDRFPHLFYQRYWDIVGPKTTEAYLEILNNISGIKDWNSAHIVLISKCDKPLLVGDFKSISLCNVNYKIVTKTIANRLKGILDEIISNS